MPVPERPNLLHIISDQHSPYVSGCYGDPLVKTPNIDRIAEQGMAFDNVYCPSPICVPSRMSMLTARHPYQNQVWTNDHILDSALPTFAHALGAAGYHPVIIGRMHSLGPDQLRGYTERYVGDHSPNHPGSKGSDRGVLNGTAGPERVSLERSGAGQSAYQVHDEYVTAATIDYLNRFGIQKQSRQSAEPFCLSVGFMLPHQPFVARQVDYDLYRNRMTLPKHPEPFSDSLHPYFRRWRQQTGIEAVSEQEILRARTAYWALVTRMDIMIGQIIAALHANNLADNTLIIYTSDHGEQVGEHGLWWKQSFYEASVRVPLIMSWPGVIPAATRCKRVVSALDITATILEALGAPPLPNSSGHGLLGLVGANNSDDAWEDEAFSEYCTDEGWYTRMIRRGEWKLNYYHGYEPQLFHLASDPNELVDRAQDPASQNIRHDLTERVLHNWHPEQVAKIMATKREDSHILKAWARHSNPEERYLWDLHPEMNWLEK